MVTLADCRWPEVDEHYAIALREAVEFVLDRFNALAVVACGSILRGDPGPTSDWDVYVIHAALKRQRIQRRFNDVPAEIFVNPPQSVRGYFRDEHGAARPVTAHMLATGWTVLDLTGIGAELSAEARTWLAKKPEPSASELTWLRYMAVDLLDNARDVRDGDPANAAMLLNQAVDQMVSYVFWERQRFQPRAKAMLTELAAIDSDSAALARQFYLAADIDQRFELAIKFAQRTINADTFFAWASALEEVKSET